ncbi:MULTISPECIES: DUF4429 domain-containing protein [unclassified Frondihabitans]|uniref:DUF4429 domain-containing protein n=1 Tax=unclassified Frondihabitans TaxID=2626248 RepID=UPI0013159F42|nr:MULTISPECIES: DUF4429 domain-containing protein [unclassified Frondihabitans]
MDYSVKGHNGQITFDGETVAITREGFFGRIGQGRSTKSLPIRSIGAVQFKPASALVNGYLQFSVQGEVSQRNNQLGSRVTGAAADENSVIFTKKQQAEFQELADALTDAVRTAHQPQTVAAAPDLADQLQKLAGLRDSGILTPQEFDAKKADILARM